MSAKSARSPFYVVEVRDHLTKFYNLPSELPVRSREEADRVREGGYNIKRGLEAMMWVVENRPEYEHTAAYRRFLLKWPIIIETKDAIARYQFNDALIRLDAMVTMDEADPSAHYHLGLVYRYVYEFPQSESSLRRCLDLYPELAIGHRALGFTLAYLKRTEEAVAELELALERLPDDPETLRALHEIRAQ
jgi:tetratricopeptide (TPR) repeat protein